jgi:hypothetical protein
LTDYFGWGSRYGKVAVCGDYSNVNQGHGLGKILLNKAHDMVEWLAVVSTQECGL